MKQEFQSPRDFTSFTATVFVKRAVNWVRVRRSPGDPEVRG